MKSRFRMIGGYPDLQEWKQGIAWKLPTSKLDKPSVKLSESIVRDAVVTHLESNNPIKELQ